VNLSSGGAVIQSPRVAIDAAGDATVVWDRIGAHEGVEAATRSAASGSFSKPAVR
jgi:hypothetical protein